MAFLFKRIILAACIAFCFAQVVFAQTLHPDYYDGRLYVKVHQTANYTFPQFKTLDAPERRQIPINLLVLFEKYGVSYYSKPAVVDDPILQKYYEVHFDKFEQTKEFMADLQKLPYFEIVEPIAILKKYGSAPNDYNAQTLFHIQLLQALDGWDYLNQNFPNRDRMIVAIVDDAVFIDHEDLKDNIYQNDKELLNGLDDDFNGFVDDIHGFDMANNDNDPSPPTNVNFGQFSHGTHCAGIAGATTNNGKGVASVSGNNVWILPVRCSFDGGGGQNIDKGYEGIQYAAKSGAKVISCSWGGGGSDSFGSQSINYARNKGCLVIAAAGNDNTEIGGSVAQFPANYQGVINVGATGPNDDKTSYSNFGAVIDVCAPGDIYSTIYLPGVNDQYTTFNGTSMSTPMVAGLAGTLYSAYPDLTVEEASFYIGCGCDDINGKNPNYKGKLGSGRVNLYKTFQCFKSTPCGTVDTLSEQFPGEPTLIQDPNGYIAGTNQADAEKGYVELYNYHSGTYFLKSMRAKFGFATPGNTTSIFFRLYRVNDNGSPGTMIASKTIALDAIADDIANDRMTEIVFDDTIYVGTKFFAGFTLTGTSAELAIETSGKNTNNSDNYTFVRIGNAWQSFKALRSFDVHFALFPVVFNTPIFPDINITQTGTPQAGKELTFTPGSVVFDRALYSWDFGDGVTKKQLRLPKHIFQQEGEYWVKFTINNGLCTYTDSTLVTIGATSAEEAVENRQLHVYPNPTQGALTVELPQQNSSTPIYLTVYNAMGQAVWRQTQVSGAAKTEIDLSALPSGVYALDLATEGKHYASRVVLTR